MKIDTPERTDAPAPPVAPPPARPRLSLNSIARGFSALAMRNYRLFWIGQLISLTGSWMQRTAQDWLVIQLTHSPFALGLVTVCQFLPITLLSLVGGVITDRWPKRRLLLSPRRWRSPWRRLRSPTRHPPFSAKRRSTRCCPACGTR